MLKAYLVLTKPGRVFGNIITATAGFLLAARGNIDFGLFLATIVGLSLIIASACVFNNYIDRDIDANMSRTRKRALVAGSISGSAAISYASLLGLAGVLIMAFYTNFLSLLVALTGFFFYVVAYGIWKRRSSFGTIVGSVAGATPPVVGYTAVSGRLDTAALLLFLILVLWQMPHFYAIAIYRLRDYKSASIPVLPAKKGIRATKYKMLIYIGGFILAALALGWFGYTGNTYLLVAAVLGSVWLWLSVKGLQVNNDRRWARDMFKLSLVVLTLLCVFISLDAWLL